MLNNQKGWIYIDALVGLIVLSVGLLALTIAFRQSTITGTRNTNYDQAVYIAEQTVEEFRRNDGRQIANADFSLTTPQTFRGIVYNIEGTPIAVNNITELITNHLILPYRVTVSWTDNATNNIHSVQLISYYYFSP